jgi:hypothetical protein
MAPLPELTQNLIQYIALFGGGAPTPSTVQRGGLPAPA